MSELSFEQLKGLEELRHNNKMEELKFERVTWHNKSEEEKGTIRLKTANETRMLERKEHYKETSRQNWLKDKGMKR